MKYLKNIAIALALIAGILTSPNNASADPFGDLVFLTENYAPFNYEHGGKTQGSTVELLLKMFKQAGSSKTVNNITVMSWAEGYSLAQEMKNTVLFSTTRTKARENMFKWVGPIKPTTISIIASKSNNIKINNFEDLNAYRVAAVREDIGELLLKVNGIHSKNIQPTRSSTNSAKMLIAGRVDAWAYEESVAFWNLNEEGQNTENYEVIYVLEKSQLYFAVQKDTDDAVVAQLQAALDAVRAADRQPEH